MQNILLTTDEVADILRIQRRTVQLKIRREELAAVNVGTDDKPCWRIEQSEVDRFIQERTQGRAA